jgi:hypothetical protein
MSKEGRKICNMTGELLSSGVLPPAFFFKGFCNLQQVALRHIIGVHIWQANVVLWNFWLHTISINRNMAMCNK